MIMEVAAAVAASLPAMMLLVERASTYLERGFTSEAKASVDDLKSTLTSFRAYLSNNGEGFRGEGCPLTKDFVDKIQDLVLEIEDALDEFIYDVPYHSHGTKIRETLHELTYATSNHRAVQRLSKRRREIEVKNKKVQEQYSVLSGGQVSRGSSSVHAARDVPTTQILEDQDEMVGFKKRRTDLFEQLVEVEPKRCVTIQVVGPGGSGKTFLVNNLFRSQEIKQIFAVKAWVVVSRHSQLEDRLLEVLRNSCPRSTVEWILDQPGSIGEKLYRHLINKRYLIVLDDIWSKQDYESISKCLPQGSSSSRIVITTRNSNVVDKPDHIHKLDGLTKTQANELFCREAFPRRQGQNHGTCPQALRTLCEKIIERCDRLPHAIVAVARMLSNRPPIFKEWYAFLNNIGLAIKSNESVLFNRILKPSFVDLPDNLKSCFLYFSMFPEGHSVTRGRLIRSWIGEGFVEEIRGKTLEDIAESYLNDLIGRSLVQVSSPDQIDGQIKSFKVLRLHHEFIVHELYGRKQNFFGIIDENTPSSSFEKIRRLSVQHVDVTKKLSEINDPSHVRTLFAFGEQKVSQKDGRARSMLKKLQGRDDSKLENVFGEFKLLKVLDLQGMPLREFPKHIESFRLLRCLNLRHTNITTVPRSIKRLTYLESLDMKYTLITELPKWICKLQKLRHLLASKVSSSSEVEGVEVAFEMGALSKSLHKVSLIKAKDSKGFFKGLESLEELRKSHLEDLKQNCGLQLCKSIEKMKNLSTLVVRSIAAECLDLDHEINPPVHIQCLRLKGELQSLPGWISSLPSLVKVVLKWSKLQNPLEILEDLPSLSELEMVECCTSKKLIFKNKAFEKLKKLHVEQFNELTEVLLGNNAMPALQKLTICKCNKLRPLPPNICLGKLEELVVYEMGEAFISDVYRRIGNLELVDNVQPVDAASSSSAGARGGSRPIVSRRYLS